MSAVVRVYADHNATTPALPEAVAAMVDALGIVGNASSVHACGRAARMRLEAARGEVASLIGARPASIVFTSGGTEANNAVLAACAGRRIVRSAIEHDSLRAPAPEALVVPVVSRGVVDLAALERVLADAGATALVSVMVANNETGAIQPIREVVEIARRYGALVHADAAQALGKIDVDVSALGVDYLTMSAHKFGGPAGIGAIYVRPDAPWSATSRGGGQERSRRAGTENLAGAAGFAAACRHARLAEPWSPAVRDRFENAVRAASPDVDIVGAATARLPNTSCLRMRGVPAQTQVMAFDLAGVAVSAGAACSSGKVAPSHVLQAMGTSAEAAAEAVRISFGRSSTTADADRVAAVWLETYERLGPAATTAAKAA